MPEMKEVQYNGILTFRIPRAWVEEKESDGLGVYYLPAPDSGTLRVTLLSLRKPGGARNAAEYARELEKTLSPAPVEALTNGHLLKKLSEDDVEDGTAIRLYTWQLARLYPPDSIRLAVFTHTVLPKNASKTSIDGEVAMIDEEVRLAQFIDLSPEQVARQMD